MSDVDLSRWRFMVIDDVPVLRQSLRAIIQTMGGFEVDMAQGYNDALHRIKQQAPDVVLCDYILGKSRDGQQLLEEVRRARLIPDEAIWMMVTGEQAYEQVVACVELVPDDYVIKPFSPELLRLRLMRIVAKKALFRPYYQQRREGRYAEARAYLAEQQVKPEHRAYRLDFLRLGAELELARGAAVPAERAYRAILEIHDFPWASAGVARALLAQRRLDESREVVDRVVAAAPMFFGAAELKADVCAEQGDHAAAQATLAELDAKSPRNLGRKRRLAAAALANGDAATARAVLADVALRELAGNEGAAADYLAMARTAFDAGDADSAELALRKVPADAPLDLDDKLCQVALAATLTPDAGRARFLGMREAWLGTPMKEERLVDALRAALALGEHALADRIATRLMTEEGIKRVFRNALDIYSRYGRGAEFREIQRQAALARIGGEPAAEA